MPEPHPSESVSSNDPRITLAPLVDDHFEEDMDVPATLRAVQEHLGTQRTELTRTIAGCSVAASQRYILARLASTLHVEVVRKTSPAKDPESKRRELAEYRNVGMLSPHDCCLHLIEQLRDMGMPLKRKDLTHETGEQAVVITRENLEDLRGIEFIDEKTGERVLVGSESLGPDDVLILYPWEVGNQERK